MYLAIITLPILGSIVSGFFGRKVGVSGAQLITCTCVIVTTILAMVAFYEVGLNNIPVSINLIRWIDSESLNVSWGFQFDSLTVAMLLPVLIVSSLVHVYSIGYMSHDPHQQRFFSYLSLFTFMMIILVTANNYLLMFVGPILALYIRKFISWHSINCWNIFKLKTTSRESFLKYLQRLNMEYPLRSFKNNKGKDIVLCFMWIKLLLLWSINWLTLLVVYILYFNYTNLLFISKEFYKYISNYTKISRFSKQYKQEYELTQEQRYSIIGIMLADGSLERGKPTFNTRLRIDHTYPEKEQYVLRVYTLFASLIANEPVIIPRKPDIRTGKVYKSIYIRTLNFPCLNKYHDIFYKDKIKVVPINMTLRERFVNSYRISSFTDGRRLFS